MQHIVNPGQLYVTGTQLPLAPPSECVSCTAPHWLARYPHTKNPCDLDLWPM